MCIDANLILFFQQQEVTLLHLVWLLSGLCTMATEEKKPETEGSKTQSTPSSSTNQSKVCQSCASTVMCTCHHEASSFDISLNVLFYRKEFTKCSCNIHNSSCFWYLRSHLNIHLFSCKTGSYICAHFEGNHFHIHHCKAGLTLELHD